MTEVQTNRNKLFYGINEVAEMFDVKPSLIRYWETQFPSFTPRKNQGRKWAFTEDDIQELRLIYHLVKEKGMKLKGAQQKIKDNREDSIKEIEILSKLERIKQDLLEIKQELS